MGIRKVTKNDLEEPRRRVADNPALYVEACKNFVKEIFRPNKRVCCHCPMAECLLPDKYMTVEKDCSVFRILFSIKLQEYKWKQNPAHHEHPCIVGYGVPGLNQLGIIKRGVRRLGDPLLDTETLEAFEDEPKE